MKRFFRQVSLRVFVIPLLKLAIFPSYFLFRNNFKNLKKIQEKKLNTLLDDLQKTEFKNRLDSNGPINYSSFVKVFKPSQYSDWLEFVEREKKGSGSSRRNLFCINLRVEVLIGKSGSLILNL